MTKEHINKIVARLEAGGRLFIIGNGGSYANAMHICNDVLLAGYPAFTLDPATLTAFANDFGYAHVYSKWLRTVGREGDVLLALSGSGKSPNILNGMEEAKTQRMLVLLETHFLKDCNMQESEEDQLFLGHELMRRLRK